MLQGLHRIQFLARVSLKLAKINNRIDRVEKIFLSRIDGSPWLEAVSVWWHGPRGVYCKTSYSHNKLFIIIAISNVLSFLLCLFMHRTPTSCRGVGNAFIITKLYLFGLRSWCHDFYQQQWFAFPVSLGFPVHIFIDSQINDIVKVGNFSREWILKQRNFISNLFLF